MIFGVFRRTPDTHLVFGVAFATSQTAERMCRFATGDDFPSVLDGICQRRPDMFVGMLFHGVILA